GVRTASRRLDRRLRPWVRSERDSRCCKRLIRRCSPGVANCRSCRSPSEVTTATATPRSTPIGGLPFGATSATPSSTQNEMYQRPPSRLTVALRTVPPSGRVHRNLTGPNFGNLTSPHRRLSRRTVMWFGSGNRNDGAVRALRSEEHTSELQSRENHVCRPL